MPISYPLAWPRTAMNRPIAPTQAMLHCRPQSWSGGQTFFGEESFLSSPSRRWEGKLALPAMDPQTLLEWQSFVTQMSGRVGTALVPAFTFGRAPWPLAEDGTPLSPVRDGLTDLLGLGYPSTIDVTARVAAKQDTELTLDAHRCGIIRPGHRFSIGSHLYEIVAASVDVGNVWTVSIVPWLRVAVTAGTACEFSNPVCEMRFASDTEGELDLERGIIARPVVNMIESI